MSDARDASLAAGLLAVDAVGLGGAALTGPPEAFIEALRALWPSDRPWRRLPAGADDAALDGGLDLAATLAAGRSVTRAGLFAEVAGGLLVIPGAERLAPALAGRIALAMAIRPFAILLLDEAREPGEGPPPALLDRVAFRLDLSSIRAVAPPTPATICAAATDADLEALCATALALGAGSPRGDAFALRAARLIAAARGRRSVSEEDLADAARLVLAPRATRFPVPPDAEPPTPDDAPAPTEDAADGALADRLVEAARAALPAELIAGIAGAAAGRKAGGRSGAAKAGLGRGRPAGVRRGQPGGGARLALVDTLRAAAPWQAVRGRRSDARLCVRRDDLRVQRVVRPVETTIVFLVDASGSAAAQRLAEAKGAVELLLARAYVTRAEAALIAFRGTGAEVLLPPTRALARAKRALADLPGGGATPLAAGLVRAHGAIDAARRRGRDVRLVILTDGRGNVALSGAVDRAAAEADAAAACARLRAHRTPVVVVDVSPRPRAEAKALADALAATYAPLPRADAAGIEALAGARR